MRLWIGRAAPRLTGLMQQSLVKTQRLVKSPQQRNATHTHEGRAPRCGLSYAGLRRGDVDAPDVRQASARPARTC